MSNIIDTGYYNVNNVLFQNKYLWTPKKQGEMGSTDYSHNFYVEVKDKDRRLVTLKDIVTGSYLERDGNNVWQLTDKDGKTVIGSPDEDKVVYMVLEGIEWYLVLYGPPPEGDGKYWIFQKLEY
ncbi:hypothetical protein BDR04DRAFT_1154569 [Suillus decipiens]|nr:hypothetical protein BDR04DRAFT_1154569 [Suillus decipiens]